MNRIWTPPLQIEDVRAVAEVVKARGGDLMCLVIRANSGATPSPTLHIDPPVPKPAKPSKGRDPIDDADAAERYRRVLVGYDERERQRLAAAEADVEAFLAAVAALLQEKPDRVATDIGRMHERAARFFDDPELPGHPSADRYFLVVSDGLDTANAVQVKRLAKPTTVLLVSAAGANAFAINKPVVLSSPQAAIRYLTNGGK